MIRTGIGYDTHAFDSNRKLFLGGIEIPFELGLRGHSDADVLIHAICDSLLGAAALGDIGNHFPDTSQEFKGIDSKILLMKVRNILIESNYQIINIDSTLIAEVPRISPYIKDMRIKLSEILEVDIDAISIKATTNEKMGFIGRKEGISALAIATIRNIAE